MRIASGLGGGVGRMGDVCGTLTGAALVLGLELGPRTREEPDAKEATYRATPKAAGTLHPTPRTAAGARSCCEKDLSIAQEYQQAKALDLFKTPLSRLRGDGGDPAWTICSTKRRPI